MKAVHKKDRPDIPSVCLCVFTSKSSLQQSRGSDPLLPRPLILLKAPPIFSIHVCRVVIAEGTLPLTHTHTHKRTLNTTELCFLFFSTGNFHTDSFTEETTRLRSHQHEAMRQDAAGSADHTSQQQHTLHDRDRPSWSQRFCLQSKLKCLV